MEHIWGVDLNLDQNQIKNAVIHSLSGSTPTSPTGGQIYYDSVSMSPHFYNGTSWISMSAISGLPLWANVVGGDLSNQVLRMGPTGTLMYHSGTINANQFFGSGTIPLTKGGTGRSSFISGAIIFADSNTEQLNSDPSGLYYYPGKKSLGIGALSTLPLSTLHLGSQVDRRPGLILSADAFATGSLNNIIGALQFNGDRLFFIDGGATYRQIIDIALSGKIPLSQGGTNTSALFSGGIVFVSGNALATYNTPIVNSLILNGSGSTLPTFVSPVNSGYALFSNGLTWTSFPLPASTGDVRIFPENLQQQTVNIISSQPLFIKSSGQTGNLFSISGATNGIFNITSVGKVQIQNQMDFVFGNGPIIYSYGNIADVAGNKGGLFLGSANDSYVGGNIRVDASGGNGGSVLLQGLTGNAGTIDLSAKNNGSPGNIDLTSQGTNAAGNITMRGNTGGVAGSLTTDGGTGGAGGSIITSATSTADGGRINTYGGSSANADGGNIDTYGASSPGGSIITIGGAASNTAGGLINTQGGSATNAYGGEIVTKGITYRGGNIITSNGGGNIDTSSGFIQLGNIIEGQSVLVKNNNASGVLQTTFLPNYNGGTLLVDELVGTAGQIRIGASGRYTYLQGQVPANSGNIVLYLPNPQPDTNIGTLVLRSNLPTGLISLSNISGYSPISGQALSWNGVVWTPSTIVASGGGATTLNDLTDVTIGTLSTGSYLNYNGSQWVNASGISHSGLFNLTSDDHGQYVHNYPLTDARNTISGSSEERLLLTLHQGIEGEFNGAANLFVCENSSHVKILRWHINNGHFYALNCTVQIEDNNQINFYQPSGIGNNYVGLRPASGIASSTVYKLPSDGTSGYVLKTDGTGNLSWSSVSAGAGTVTAIGIVPPAHLGVYGSPITVSGNITLTALNQNANLIFASPTGAPSGIPTFRSLSQEDIPSLNTSQIGFGTFANARFTAGNITQFSGSIDHDSLLNFNSNEHIDHSTIYVSGNASITGGGYLNNNVVVTLFGDAASPGNTRLYGTTDGGTKGWRREKLNDIGATFDGGTSTPTTGTIVFRPIEQNSILTSAAMITNSSNTGYIGIEIGKYTPTTGALGLKTFIGLMSNSGVQYSRNGDLSTWTSTTLSSGDVVSMTISGTVSLYTNAVLVIAREGN